VKVAYKFLSFQNIRISFWQSKRDNIIV